MLFISPTGSGLFASAAEKRSFHYFQSRTGRSLGKHFNLSFWGREVMQAAIYDPAIRHLVISLGAAYEAFEAAPYDSRQRLEKTYLESTEFALQQCNRSIRLLAAPSGVGPGGHQEPAEKVYRLLTASILFIHFASMRGHLAEAIQHVRSAVKVLQDFENRAEEHSPSPGHSYPIPLSHLRALLASSYGQLRTMINLTALEAGSQDLLACPDIKPATVFTSVADAHSYVEKLYNAQLAFHQDAEINPPTTPERVDEIVARHSTLCRALISSESALEVFAASLTEQDQQQQQQNQHRKSSSPESGSDSDSHLNPKPDAHTNTDTHKAILVLRVYHILISVRSRLNAALRPEQRESAFDEFESDLDNMLHHCEEILSGDQTQATCFSGLGCVMPLHTITARCRNPRIRRRALNLLLGTSRREGLWDSQLTGRIAAQTMEIEEELVRAAQLQGENREAAAKKRLREVRLELAGERGALIRFLTVEDWETGREGIQKTFQW